MIKEKKIFNLKKVLYLKKFYYWYETDWRNLLND